MKDFARWLPRYAKRYGLARGAMVALRTEIATKSRKDPFRIPSPDGGPPILLRGEDVGTFQQVIIKNDYDLGRFSHEEKIQRRYESEIATGKQPVIVDLGANIGLATRQFAARFPAARLIAVEPGPRNFALLQRNTAHITAIERFEGAVWSSTTTLSFVDESAGSASLQVVPTEDSSRRGIAALSVPDLMQRYGIDQVLILKIDIEGAEQEVFEADCPWLDNVGLLVIELHDWLLPGRATSAPFLRRIANGRFDCVLDGENLFCFRIGA